MPRKIPIVVTGKIKESMNDEQKLEVEEIKFVLDIVVLGMPSPQLQLVALSPEDLTAEEWQRVT